MTLQSILPFVALPVVGAVFHYVTNDIAIRMLFRPLRPWYVLGFRVPLTPGVIPAGRIEFAAKIGRMVGTHLVTGDDVARALERDTFRRELRETVSDKLDSLLDRELGTIGSLVPAGLERWLHDGAALVCRQVTDGVFAHLESDGFTLDLAACIATLEERVLPRELERLLEGERYDALREGTGRALAALLQSRGVSRAVAAAVDEKVEEFLSSERPLREILSADAAELLLAQAETLASPLLERVRELLQTPEFRDGIEGKIREGVQAYLHSLKGALGFMAGLISVEKLNQLFPGFIGNVEEELVRWLGEEETRQKVAGVIRKNIDELLDRPLAATVARVPYERVATVRRMIRKGALGLVRNPGTAEFLVSLLEREGRRFLAESDNRPLLERLVSPEEAGRLRLSLADWIASLLRAPETRRTVEQTVASKVDELFFRLPVGRLSTRIPADARRGLDAAICSQVEDMLQREVPPLIDALDVSRMVEEKVNALDILKMERLLLDIMEKHFIYINLFGALLGFIMGFINIAIARLSP